MKLNVDFLTLPAVHNALKFVSTVLLSGTPAWPDLCHDTVTAFHNCRGLSGIAPPERPTMSKMICWRIGRPNEPVALFFSRFLRGVKSPSVSGSCLLRYRPP